jgi:hypothetical protein
MQGFIAGKIHTQISSRPGSSRSRTLPPIGPQILTWESSYLCGACKAVDGHGEAAVAANMA